MKRIFLAAGLLLSVLSAKAQNIELNNNTSKPIRLNLVAFSGTGTFPSGQFVLPAGSSVSPTDVNTFWTTNLGLPALPTSNAYIISIDVFAACSEANTLDASNTGHTFCSGTSDEFFSSYEFNAVSRDVVLNND